MLMALEKFQQLDNWTDLWAKSKLSTELGSSLLMSGLHQKKKAHRKTTHKRMALEGMQ